MSNPNNRVFISYAREDIKKALRLYKDLEKLGFDVWLDVKAIKAGQKWDITIKKAINESRFFLAILSNKSVNKRGYVQKELRKAIDVLEEYPESDIYLIPVRIDACHPGFEAIREINRVDMFPSWNDGVKRIALALSSDMNEHILDEILTPNSPSLMNNPEAYVHEVDKYLKVNPNKSKDILLEGLRKYPYNRFFLGVAAQYLAFELDALQEAADIYDKMISMWPDDHKAKLSLAYFLWKKKAKIKEAKHYLSDIIDSKVIDMNAWDRVMLYRKFAEILKETGGTKAQVAKIIKEEEDFYMLIEEEIGWTYLNNTRPKSSVDERLDELWTPGRQD